MRCSKPAKLSVFTVASFVFLSVWLSLWDQLPVEIVPMQVQNIESGGQMHGFGHDRHKPGGIENIARLGQGQQLFQNKDAVDMGLVRAKAQKLDVEKVTRSKNEEMKSISRESIKTTETISSNNRDKSKDGTDYSTVTYKHNRNVYNGTMDKPRRILNDVAKRQTPLYEYDMHSEKPKSNITSQPRTELVTETKQSRTILMSYMRSGSTFTGDLLQSSADVTYLYEPLLYTNDVDELERNTQIRGRVIHKFVSDPHPPETLNFTLATLRCNLTAENMKYLIGYTYSKSFANYSTCIKNQSQVLCSQSVLKRCQKSKNVVSKILRLKMWEVDELLTLDPELNVIHLVRDPRGITMSRRVANYFINIRTLCARMNSDAALSVDLQKKYRGRILTVRYEDLAMFPIDVTKQIFHHAGVRWTPQVSNRVQDLTLPKNKSFSEKIFGTQRKNSSATAFSWRTKLPFKTAVEIQKLCSDMMTLYGYVQFNSSQEMVNSQKLSILENYSDKFYKAISSHLFGS